MGKWIVTQDYIRGEPCYMVEHSVTGKRKGTFDWQSRAQEFANELNKEEKDGDHSSLLFRAVPQERS
jgi:hypothetical protein